MPLDPVFWLYTAFGAFVIVFMAIDLAITGRNREISARQALAWTGVCVALALLFIPALYWMYERHWLGLGMATERHASIGGAEAAATFLQGWILEYSLSVDNLFVFAVIFQHFAVPRQNQHRVLAWGIIATLILRGAFILVGGVLLRHFHFLLYIAGAFLIYTAFKMLAGKEEEFEAEESRIVRAARRFVSFTPDYDGDRFFTQSGGAMSATPLFLVLLVLNVVDIVFAVDSIPAIFGITQESFIVFTSNVFAVLGLRALYFVLASLMDKFRYLKVSLAVILGFVGVKMLTEKLVEGRISQGTVTVLSLGFIVVSLFLGVWFSIQASRPPRAGPGLEIDQRPDE
ncbi:MAG: TerC/Alx family metal homeostasis membrane protein [Phycisphaerales bacterium]|nr:TerC/Alx family metal homeostasis membrane protein [Phycisphaerales bacterium]